MSADTAFIVSAVCQANDHGFGGIRVPGIRVPKKWSSSHSDGVILKKVMKVLKMNEEGLRWIESYELMIDLQSIRDPESINF
ncbi:hypothetical protein Tco_0135318 [Tanacetum coccineum]